MHVFFGALRMMFFTCCFVTREKVSRVGPQTTKKSGCLDVASSSSLNLWILVEKKSPNVFGRSTMCRVGSFLNNDGDGGGGGMKGKGAGGS